MMRNGWNNSCFVYSQAINVQQMDAMWQHLSFHTLFLKGNFTGGFFFPVFGYILPVFKKRLIYPSLRLVPHFKECSPGVSVKYFAFLIVAIWTCHMFTRCCYLSVFFFFFFSQQSKEQCLPIPIPVFWMSSHFSFGSSFFITPILFYFCLSFFCVCERGVCGSMKKRGKG
jgi:hypothetical protein